MTEMTIVWAPPVGAEINLSGAGYYRAVLPDGGWYMPPHSLVLDYYERFAMISRVRLEPRLLDIPIYVEADSQANFIAAIQALCNAFNPIDGVQGTLKVTRQDGVVRHIQGIEYTGLEGTRNVDLYNSLWMELPLVLKCLDPAWYNPTAETHTYTKAGGGAAFFPFFPLVLAPDAILQTPTIVNDGSLDAWPIWTVTGPGTDFRITNLASGKKTAFTLHMILGDELIIDTRPGHKSITLNGSNAFRYISVDSSLWPLVPGSQDVEIVLVDATADSQVDLSFNERYLAL